MMQAMKIVFEEKILPEHYFAAFLCHNFTFFQIVNAK